MTLAVCVGSRYTMAADSEDDIARVAGKIDQLMAERWEAEGVTPAPVAGDAEFIRRAHLDICGRIPSSAAVRDFLTDESPEKRRELVDRLLGSATYIVHYTNQWRAAMIPEAEADQQIRFFLPGFEAWLRSRIAENRNYAQIVEEILTLPVTQSQLQQFQQPDSPTPFAFYRAKDAKPENMAAATARIFLGIRLECAQCHDHFFDKWKQDEFWSYAAFFGSLPGNEMMTEAAAATSDDGLLPVVRIPGTERVVSAAFLDGSRPGRAVEADPRSVLVRWMTSPQNPYFAKAAVNRIWANHFGTGLVEPVDDFSEHNPPSIPQVLDLLAEEFVEHDFDVKYLIRVIMATKAYNLTSRQTHESQGRREMFARMPVRALTPEQIFDSIAQATGYQQPFNPEEPLNFNNDPARQEFLETFANSSEGSTQRQSTILQALSMMNGRFVAEATDLSESRTLAAVVSAPFLSTQQKVEALFVATLSRPPSEAEQTAFVAHVDAAEGDKTRRTAYGDLFWALLNSSEFLMNH
jgi:Protein of unknown function (DUF1553)/Protein of unknown function (DUF1549)